MSRLEMILARIFLAIGFAAFCFFTLYGLAIISIKLTDNVKPVVKTIIGGK